MTFRAQCLQHKSLESEEIKQTFGPLSESNQKLETLGIILQDVEHNLKDAECS